LGRSGPLGDGSTPKGGDPQSGADRNSPSFHGVIAAIVTPAAADEEPDERALRRVVDHVIDGGVHGIMTTGGTGEFVHFTREERKRITAIAVDQVAKRIPVIAGTAACGTREAIALTADAVDAGADAVIVTAPFYFRLPDQTLERHYLDIADASAVPVFVYNNPLYTGNPLSPELLARLGKHERIVGVKQSATDFGQLVEVIRLAHGSMDIMTGIDSQFYGSLCVGAKGIFSTAACLVPREMVAIWDAFQSGDHTEALSAHERVQAINKFLEYDPGYVAPCKAGLEMLGIPVGRPTRPMPHLSDEVRDQIRSALRQLGYQLQPASNS
jgi:4-hydroxy-tetrahydrodipicolinate synthase